MRSDRNILHNLKMRRGDTVLARGRDILLLLACVALVPGVGSQVSTRS